MAPGPSMNFNLKNWVWGSVTKATLKQSVGLDLEAADDGSIYVTKVYEIAKMFTEVQVGDKLIKFQDKDIKEYTNGVEELYDIMKREMKVTFEALHQNDSENNGPTVINDIQKGDRVPLINYKANPEYNGRTVEVLREVKGGQWLVKLIELPLAQPMETDDASMKGKVKKDQVKKPSAPVRILVPAENLYYELCPEMLTLKEYDSSDEEVEENNKKVEKQLSEKKHQTPKKNKVLDQLESCKTRRRD